MEKPALQEAFETVLKRTCQGLDAAQITAASDPKDARKLLREMRALIGAAEAILVVADTFKWVKQ